MWPLKYVMRTEHTPVTSPSTTHTHDTMFLNTLYTKMMDGKQMRGEKWWTYRDEEKGRSKSGKWGRESWPERERCRRHSENDRRVVEMIWSLYRTITHTDIGKTLHWNSEWRVQKSYCRWLTIKIHKQNRIQLQRTQELYWKGGGIIIRQADKTNWK